MFIIVDLVVFIFRFLMEVGNSYIMKDWFGGFEVNLFWIVFLFLLCYFGFIFGSYNLGV